MEGYVSLQISLKPAIRSTSLRLLKSSQSFNDALLELLHDGKSTEIEITDGKSTEIEITDFLHGGTVEAKLSSSKGNEAGEYRHTALSCSMPCTSRDDCLLCRWRCGATLSCGYGDRSTV